MKTSDRMTDDDLVLRRQAIFPSVTLVGSLPTVNGISYYSWQEALDAKAAGVTYALVDIFGRMHVSR